MTDFKYPTDIEDKVFETLPEGKYPFETVSCKEGKTTKGDPKVVLILNLFDNAGAKWTHTLHITATNAYHLKAYWNCVGEPHMFEELANRHDEFAFMGKCGMAKTRLEDNEWEGKKMKRSVVSYFIKKEDQVKNQKEKSNEPFVEDEIPF